MNGYRFNAAVMGANTYTEPHDIADLFGVNIGNAEIVRFRRGCEHRRAELTIRVEMIDGYAELNMLPKWRHDSETPERPANVKL